ncbi:hypothetical protein ACFXKH_40725 [Streptomyces caelestis]|uniref:hypothetical protein n=1 Tax=Streptomyces caelestis TaxID=36816 RepID=UPI0036A48D09
MSGLSDVQPEDHAQPASRLEDPQVTRSPAWPGYPLERHGWEYAIWSGAQPTLLENVRFLAAYRHRGCRARSRCGACVAGDSQSEEARPSLMALLWPGRLTTGLVAGPLSGACVLRRRG